jgi:hypothetical protein
MLFQLYIYTEGQEPTFKLSRALKLYERHFGTACSRHCRFRFGKAGAIGAEVNQFIIIVHVVPKEWKTLILSRLYLTSTRIISPAYFLG